MSRKNFADYIEKKHPLIKELMLERQKAQIGKKDWNVFKNSLDSGFSTGGFTWGKTKEGHAFWEKVLFGQEVDIFYEKYPKPSEIEVW